MNPALIAQIVQVLLVAEPPVVDFIHSLLTGTGNAADASVLQQDVIDWQSVQAKAKAELGIQ